MKTTTKLIITSLTFITLSSCSQHPYQSVPTNNWTQEDKDLIKKHVHQWLDTAPIPEVSNNVSEIADRSLNQCIINYPDINEFKKHNLFQSAESVAMTTIEAEYIKH